MKKLIDKSQKDVLGGENDQDKIREVKNLTIQCKKTQENLFHD
jgi:hypothetical protein